MDKPDYGDRRVPENAKFYTLSAAVYSVLADLEYGEELFNKFLGYAIECVKELTFDVTYEVHYEVIDMQPWKQITLPGNMVDWSKIGFKVGDSIKVFTNDSSISRYYEKDGVTPKSNVPESLDSEQGSTDEIVEFAGGFNYGMRTEGNPFGYFSIDWKHRVIDFKRSVNAANKVYLEFISDGINYNGATIIPPQGFKCVKQYIQWQRKENDDRFSDAAADRQMKLYEKEVDKFVVREMRLSIADIKEALRSSRGQTVKG